MAAAAACLSLGAAACGSDPQDAAQRSVQSGEAQRAVQALVDRSPQCATLLNGLSPLVVRRGGERRPTVRALVAADLLAPGPAAPGGPEGAVEYRPTQLGRGYLRLEPLGDLVQAKLCYARRRVVRVWLKPRRATDSFPQLGYSFVLVDAAPWTRRPDMLAAFPFLPPALAGRYTPIDFIRYDKGRWQSDFLVPILPDAKVREAFFI